MAEIDLTQFEGHTPGPWWCHGQVWIEGGGSTLADLVEASKADAALMTAAPMLLAEVKRQAEEIERLQHQADQADQIDVRSIVDALSWLGVSTPEGGTEAAAARLGRLVNYLSSAVLRHKLDHRNKCEEIERLRADADRLDWMSTYEARIGWTREGDMCRVWVREDDTGNFLPVCGWRAAFEDHRSAIDAAIKEQK